MPPYRLFIIAPKSRVKATKLILEREKRLDKSQKILRLPAKVRLEEPVDQFYILEPSFVYAEGYFLLPTTKTLDIPSPNVFGTLASKHDSILGELHLPADLFLAAQPFPPDNDPALPSPRKSPLATVIRIWRESLPNHVDRNFSWPKPPETYTIYPPLLLLPPSTLPISWPDINSTPLAPHLPTLYQFLHSRFQVTHIAINAPIPPQIKSDIGSSSSSPSPPALGQPNRLRTPSNLIPLSGSFGPPFPSPPTPSNLAAALWVSTIQHGITQIWAPLHTMFSRGNIREKARVLAFCEATIPNLEERAQSTAIDLYAGIGYFAFCYAKAGVGLVLGWELNGWSVEGGRRGAEENGWGKRVVREEEDVGDVRERLLLFHEDNENAGRRVEGLRGMIPPIRHVNLGLLPISRGSWETAVRVLDREKGGWVHAHENCPAGEIREREKEIEGVFGRLVGEHEERGVKITAKQDEAGRSKWTKRNVHCEHVEKVKTYAPGIVHCVFDICIGPLTNRNQHLSHIPGARSK